MDMTIHTDKLLAWFLPYFTPGTRVGVVWPEESIIDEELGFKAASPSDCDVMVGIEIGHKYEDPLKVLEAFRSSKVQKLVLLCLNWHSRPAFTDAVLDIDANLLERSILLPATTMISCSSKLLRSAFNYTILILDKTRISQGRNTIAFHDQSEFQEFNSEFRDKVKDTEEARAFIIDAIKRLPCVVKDFRDVRLRHEPLLASFHTGYQALINSIKGEHTPLASCADIIRCAQGSSTKSAHCAPFPCISSNDFAPYGYTQFLPPSSIRFFQPSSVTDAEFLRGGDIVLMGKSGVGKLCIVDPDIEPGKWLGSPFNLIIRPHEIDPRALYLHLMSGPVQKYFRDCSRSGSIPTLPSKALKKLPVPVLSQKEQDRMIARFERLEEIRKSIDQLEKEAQILLETR